MTTVPVARLLPSSVSSRPLTRAWAGDACPLTRALGQSTAAAASATPIITNRMRDIIDPMLPRKRGLGRLVIAALAVCATACGGEKPGPVVVEDRVVRVHNESREQWTDVRIWLNDHYVAGTNVLEPDARLTVQQRDFVAGLGQKFDPSRQSPYGVLVTAKSPSGDVKLVWGQPYKK
jgi:hypothetical protein